jgi:hypothetical protein
MINAAGEFFLQKSPEGHGMRKLQSATSGKHLRRIRRICAALPETEEKLSHGEPTFFVRKKVFAMFANNHHNDGHIAVAAARADRHSRDVD